MKRALCCTLLTFGLTLPLSAPATAEKPLHLALVIQNSGAHRLNALAILALLERLVASKPEAEDWIVIGFAEKFEQVSAARFRRSPAVFSPRTSDLDRLRDAVTGLVFQGPSPIYDAVSQALRSKPEVLLLISNGVDNASETGFEDLLGRVSEAGTRIVSLHFPTEASGGGESRLRKLAKASGGKLIDIRAKNSWDELVVALR